MQENERHIAIENKSSNKSFGLVMTTFFLILGVFPFFQGGPLRIWALAFSGIFLALSFLKPEILKPLNYLWFKLGLLLHKIVSPIILGIMFYVVLTPMALALRLFNKDFLRLKIDPNLQSYWIKREPPGPSPESLNNQF